MFALSRNPVSEISIEADFPINSAKKPIETGFLDHKDGGDFSFMKLKQIVIFLSLVGFGLRIYAFDFQPLWWDEGWSFYAASLPSREMVAATAADIHPPLYYALLRLWLQVAGPGPELARFLSALFGVLLIPLGYLFGREILLLALTGQPPGREPANQLGVAAAVVITAAPLAVYYSQEVRMYGLVTLLGLSSTLFFVQLLRGRRSAFGLYVITTTLALYTMYYAAFIPITHGCYWLVRYRTLKPERRASIFKALVVVSWLYLPWVIYAGEKLLIYVQGKTVVEADTPLNLLEFLRHYLTAFSLGHLSAGLQPYAWLAWGGAAIAGLGWWFLRSAGQSLLVILYLFVPLLSGWLINLANPFTPRFFERTLLIAAPAWWVLMGAGLLWAWRRQKFLASVVAGLWLLGCWVSLFDFYRLPRYPADDYRPLLAKIAALADTEDVLLASYEWQLGYYEAYLPQPRPRLYAAPEWGQLWGRDAERMRADLAELLEHNIWFPAHQTLGRDWETRAETIMAEIGYPALIEWYGESTKLSLVGRKMPTQPGPSLNFQNKLLAEVRLPGVTEFEAGRGIVPLEVSWRKLAELEGEYFVALKLVDAGGDIWASHDSFPTAATVSFNDLAVGEWLTDRRGLLIPAGTPPGLYDLRLSVTNRVNERPLDILDQAGQPQGAEATLARVNVILPKSPVSPQGLAVQRWTDWTFNDQLKLVGYSVGQWTAKTGEVLPVNLFWQSLSSDLPELTMFVQLQDGAGQALALTERPPVYATTAWPAEMLLRDLHKLRLPATMPPGSYKLAVGVLRPDKTRLQTSAGDQVVLGEVKVEARPHNFEPPQPQFSLNEDFSGSASLIGYDLDRSEDLKPGNPLTLTLYWQGQAGFERSWTVFAHVVDAEGRIWGQRDQLPGEGAFPTTGWTPGEYIADTRQIFLNAATPPGLYFIKVGLYDAQTANFARLPVGEGDAIMLETPIRVLAR